MYYIPENNTNTQQPTIQQEGWLNYIITHNPQGVMRVLNSNGYTGYLAPQNENEMYEACLVFQNKDENGTEKLLMAHPDFQILQDIFLKVGKQRQKLNNNNNGKMNNFQKDELIDFVKKEKRKILKVALITLVSVYVIRAITNNN